MGKHSEDRETIIHEVIPVIVIKLNYVKQLQDLKKSSAWNIYKKPYFLRNCSVDIACPVHNHRLLEKKMRFWCFMMATLPFSDSILMKICVLRSVISLIYFYTCNVCDDNIDSDIETVQEQLAVLIEEIDVKMMLDDFVRK